MAKPEWGKKRTCQSCGVKYYDFNKIPMTCPSCGAEFDPDILLKTKKGKNLSSKVTTRNDNDLTEGISNIDDIEVDTDSEVVSDDEPILEIKNEDQKDIAEDDIVIDEDISFIEDDELSDENGMDVEISEKDKS